MTRNLATTALLALMSDTPRQRRQVERFVEIHHTLRQDTATKAAEAVLGVLDATGNRRMVG